MPYLISYMMERIQDHYFEEIKDDCEIVETEITVIRANDLPQSSAGRDPKTRVEIIVGEYVFSTRSVARSLNPQYEESFTFLATKASSVSFEVQKTSTIRWHVLGELERSMETLWDMQSKLMDEVLGEVTYYLELDPESLTPHTPNPSLSIRVKLPPLYNHSLNTSRISGSNSVYSITK